MEHDRQIIRIDMRPEHVGVMSALRRAFEDVAPAQKSDDFEDLLRQLN